MNDQSVIKLPLGVAVSRRVGTFCLTSMLFVLVMVVVSWPRPAHALGGQCVWEGGPGAQTYPSCKLEDCIGAGGLAVCTAPEVRPTSSVNDSQVDGQKFQYGACDVKAPLPVYQAGWCYAAGGTWTGINGCVNYHLPVTESDVVSESDRFITIVTNGCSPAVSSDSGWGFDDTGDTVCGGSTTFKNGLLMSDVRQRVYAPCGQDGFKIILGKVRALQCPNTVFSRTQPNGNLQCFLPAERCCGIGHQVSPVTGAEMTTEPDYRMGGAGGFELAHYYNSQGRFRLPDSGPFIAGVSDYWHFSYDRHLIAVSGNSELLAIVQREAGTLEAFDGSGHEILNRTGAADLLAGSAGGGWTLTLANSDVESYDSGGRLNSITTRSGMVTTISYGTNGAISRVTDSFGYQLTYTSNASGQLISVTLPDGQSAVSYGYDSMGRLISVTYPDGTSRTYQYEDPANSWLLSGITDENNQRYVTFRYTTSTIFPETLRRCAQRD